MPLLVMKVEIRSLGLFLQEGLIAANYFVNCFGHTVYPSGFYFVHKKLKVRRFVKKGQNV